jgi:hypothetical protein
LFGVFVRFRAPLNVFFTKYFDFEHPFDKIARQLLSQKVLFIS